jgi:hypothetical protein
MVQSAPDWISFDAEKAEASICSDFVRQSNALAINLYPRIVELPDLAEQTDL